MRDVTVTLRTKQTLGPVSQRLFGHFIEFMHDCIDPGLYAEMLLSRGFENPSAEEGVSQPWQAFGDVHCVLDNEVVYAPSQSQRITSTQGEGGIQQGGLLLRDGISYEGYVYLCVEQCAAIRLSMRDDLGTVFMEETQLKPACWNRLAFQFTPSRSSRQAIFSITLISSGTLWIDQASLRPANRIAGVWPDVMERIAALRMGVLRFPGGCFADTYHWKDGVGPVDCRPSRPNRHWGGIEQNHFGSDEFMSLCHHLDCEPIICVNFGGASPEEAANWVEYMNGDPSTLFGAMRAANGHASPYGVRYWDIGNEMFAEWENGHCTAVEYAQRYLSFAKAMRARDASIRLIACAGDGNQLDQQWNENILPVIRQYVDVLALHTYAPMIADAAYKPEVLYDAVVGGAPVKFAQVLQQTQATVERLCGADSRISLAVTEWNTSYHNDSLREQTFEAALSNAGLMNVFLRNAAHLSLCTASDLINGWPGGLIRSMRGEAFGTPTYHAICLYANQGLTHAIYAEGDSDTYTCEKVGNIEAQTAIPLVDVAAGCNLHNEIVLFAINRSRTESARIHIKGASFSGWRGMSLHADNFDHHNDLLHETLVPMPMNVQNGIVLKPMTIAAIILESGEI